MINQIQIQNFKCLRDVTVDLEPLTVLIGANNSGKTSLLEAIWLLGQTTNRSIVGQSSIFGDWLDSSMFWRRRKDIPINWLVRGTMHESKDAKFEYQLDIENIYAKQNKNIIESLIADDFDYDTDISIKKSINTDDTHLNTYLSKFNYKTESKQYEIAESLRSSQIYKFDPTEARVPSAPTGGLLNPRGDNLAAVLDALVTGPERASFDALEKILTKTFPDLSGIALPSSNSTVRDASGQTAERLVKSIDFVLAGKERPKLTIPASRVSDGVMLLTAYLALAYSETPEIILLEEPENGLHPSRLKMVIDLLRKMTSGEIGNRKRQIILTTHSPLLLNYCEKEEVRIVRRGADDGSQVTPLSAVPGIDKLLNEFAIGELWNLLGEEGLLKDADGGARA